MKKMLWIVLGVVVVLVVAVVAVPFLIPTEVYKEELRKQVRAQTGRELTIDGAVSLSLLPRTQVVAEQVGFSNADWAEPERMAELERLRVRVNPWALISGDLEIESFVLDRPTIHLAVDDTGRGNWEFAPADAPAPDPEAPADPAARELPLADIRLGEARIENGTVTFTDMATGERQQVDEVSLSLELETLDAPFAAEGALRWNDERIELALTTGAPRGLLDGRATAVALTLESAPLRMTYEGDVTLADEPQLAGAVEIDVTSLKRLAAWAGEEEIEAPEGALEAFNLAGQVDARGQRFDFEAERLRLDEITGEGGLSVDVSGPRPRLSGRLDLAQLDLTPYLPEPTEPAADAPAPDAPDEAAQPAEWNDDPIDLAALHAADARFDLSVAGIRARDVTVGRSALGLTLESGRLQADLEELNLYDGQGSGQVVLDDSGDRPGIAMRFDLDGVQSHPLLSDLADFDRLEGRGAVTLDVFAHGRSQKEMVEGLNGEGAISFTDGAIVGINLAAMVRNVTTAFTDAGGTQKTDFAELAGTFTIQDGILRNDDLLLLNPLLRVRGSGSADLPQRTVDYRVVPRAVASLEGQGGDFATRGLAVPVIVRGPWHDLTFRPDLESIVRDAVRDPQQMREGAEEMIRGLREGGQDGLRGVLEGFTGGEAGDDGDTGADRLRGVLEGLTGGRPDSGDAAEDGDAGEEAEPTGPARQLRRLFGD